MSLYTGQWLECDLPCEGSPFTPALAQPVPSGSIYARLLCSLDALAHHPGWALDATRCHADWAQPCLLSSPAPYTEPGPPSISSSPTSSLRSCPHCGCPEGPPPGQSHRLGCPPGGCGPCTLTDAALGGWTWVRAPGPSCCALCPCRPGPAPQAISGVGAILLGVPQSTSLVFQGDTCKGGLRF